MLGQLRPDADRDRGLQPRPVRRGQPLRRRPALQPHRGPLPGPPPRPARRRTRAAGSSSTTPVTAQNNDPTRYPQGGLSATNTLRVGDTLNGLDGVMDFRFGNYRIQPVGAVKFVPTNLRTPAPAAVGGNLKVASFNVLNYFNGNGLGGGFPTSRGAETVFEFDRQEAKIVSALKAIDADIVGLMEIENDGGPTSALAELVGALNAATAPGTYAFVDTGVIGTDEIKVALIYKPAEVMPVGTWDILTTADDPRFLDTRNRPTLAQTFRDLSSTQVLTVAVNHLKSKGSACGGVPDDQPDTGGRELQRHPHGGCRGARGLARERPDGERRRRLPAHRRPQLVRVGDADRGARGGGLQNLVREYGGLTRLLVRVQRRVGLPRPRPRHRLDRGPGHGRDRVAHQPGRADACSTTTRTSRLPNQITTFYDPGPYRASDHDPVVDRDELRPRSDGRRRRSVHGGRGQLGRRRGDRRRRRRRRADVRVGSRQRRRLRRRHRSDGELLCRDDRRPGEPDHPRPRQRRWAEHDRQRHGERDERRPDGDLRRACVGVRGLPVRARARRTRPTRLRQTGPA